jgi:hypothetical protein
MEEPKAAGELLNLSLNGAGRSIIGSTNDNGSVTFSYSLVRNKPRNCHCNICNNHVVYGVATVSLYFLGQRETRKTNGGLVPERLLIFGSERCS